MDYSDEDEQYGYDLAEEAQENGYWEDEGAELTNNEEDCRAEEL